MADRIYQHTQQEHIITNVVSGRKMRLQKYNFPDSVIWNPWQEKGTYLLFLNLEFSFLLSDLFYIL